MRDAIPHCHDRRPLPIRSDLPQPVFPQDRVGADVVGLVVAVGAAQDHVSTGAGGGDGFGAVVVMTSVVVGGALVAAGVRISMDGRGRWMDNVFIERLWRSLKHEDIYLMLGSVLGLRSTILAVAPGARQPQVWRAGASGGFDAA